jgi:glutathione S-transferase
MLDAGDVKHEAIHVSIVKGEHKTDEIKKINPKGTIPFITVDDVPYYESAAILRYLAVRCPEINKFYPKGQDETRARIDAALDWNGTSFRPNSIYFAPIIMTKFMKKAPSTELQALTDGRIAKLPGLFTFFNDSLAEGGTKFIAGNDMCIADFQIYCQMTDVNMTGTRSMIDAYPHVSKWYDNVTQYKGVKEIHEGKAYTELYGMIQVLYNSKVE